MKLRGVDWVFVVAMLLFAAGLRLTGIAFGQPDSRFAQTMLANNLLPENTPLHPDEHVFVHRPLKMLLTGKYNPEFFINPSFLINLNFFTYLLTDSGDGLTTANWEGVSGRSQTPFRFFIIGRTYSALGGMFAVAAVYATALRMRDRYAALVAGLLTTVAFPLVQHAHYATTSSLAAGFVAVCVWASFASLRQVRHRRVWFLLAGIAAGLATGNRYNASAVSIVVFLAGLVLLYRHRTRQMLTTVLAGWALFPITFVITTPHIIFDTQAVIHDFNYILGEYVGGDNSRFTTSMGMFFEYRYLILYGIGIPAAMMVLLALYAAWHKRPHQSDTWLCHNSLTLYTIMLLLYALPYSLFVLRTARPIDADQLLLPITPIFTLLAGIGAAWFDDHVPNFAVIRRLASAGLVLIVIVMPLMMSLQFVRQLATRDTRQIAQEWVYQHLPAGSRIQLSGPYNVPLDPADYQWTQTVASDLITLDELREMQVDYVILSDAWYINNFRADEIVPQSYRDELQAHLDLLRQNLIEVARIDRPQWRGNDDMLHTASYYHNPGLIIYCTNAASCAAVR
ncbi:MAG: phospholipid carrier-dependent glycosyltransferase [Chloroflexi bacterium]|nr:MAG: hypothetical protein CUN54_03550 [Phototrophicales bacterium]RMF79420.1 MAG: phospholipid carrier-dependent glycosyltransferase [Chloroflexota bacterium]